MNKQVHQAPRVKLKPDLNKIMATLCFVIKEAEHKGWEVTQYDIVKTIFLADKSHLNNYGRPITFDNYVAMVHGPVPSHAYDILKGGDRAVNLEKLGIKKVARSSKVNSYTLTKAGAAKADFSLLSDSDKNALSNSLAVVRSLGFSQIRRLTHEDPAYTEAWKDDDRQRSYPMSYGMLFESPDFEAAENIKYFSENR